MSAVIRSSSYDIFIGNDVFFQLSKFISREYPRSKKIILVDENTKQHCFPLLSEHVTQLKDAVVIEIKSGEESKSLATCEYLWNELTNAGADRRSLLINLGGGVVGDLGGFVAATYLRGIDFINVPTTLLSMVDASVGGKNGINFAGMKNQVGTFTKPCGVFISPVFLKTLPIRELNSGFSEIIKHALIYDRAIWEELKTLEDLQSANWIKLITDSVTIKNNIVSVDYKDRHKRKTLNFGHTIGHAIESYSLSHHSVPLKHGEAIAFGMIAETYISLQMGKLSDQISREIFAFIQSHFGSFTFSVDADDIINRIRHDKKNEFSEFNFVLLKEIGVPEINQQPEENLIREAIEFILHPTAPAVQQA